MLPHKRRHHPPIYGGGVGTKTVTVGSIAALKTALADNSVDIIIVQNGTYHVSPSNAVAADSLWIGSNASGGFPFAERTRSVTVRAQTIGGVTFDGTAGGAGYGGLSFEDGAHHQTWQGFNFTNMQGDHSGIVEIGGYTPRNPPHDIYLYDFVIGDTNTRLAAGSNTEHGIYVSNSLVPGPYNIWMQRFTLNSVNALHLIGGIHGFHGDPSNPFANSCTFRDFTINGFQQSCLIWPLDPGTMTNWYFKNFAVTNAFQYAFSFEDHRVGTVTLDNFVSTGSASAGWNSSVGVSPAAIGWNVINGTSLN